MKPTYIYAMLAVSLLGMASTACNDNIDPGFEPFQKPLILKVDGNASAFSENYNAAQRSYELNVESNTLWRVEATSTGGWISLDKVSGRGNESFTFSLRDNMLDDVRHGTVTVYMVNAVGEALDLPGSSIALTVNQNFSNVFMRPSSLDPFKPDGNERTQFVVTANVAWTLDVSYEGDDTAEFISITPESGDMQRDGEGAFIGNGEAKFYMSIADNRTSRNRKAYLNLRSDGNIGSYSVEITQNKSENYFDVSPSESQTVGAKGGSITYGVLAVEGIKWSVNCADDWISFTAPSYPEESDKRGEIIATIAPNPTGDIRSATVRFNPNDKRYEILDVTIIQQGWDNPFDITPKEDRVVAASGGSLDFSILSMVGWTAVSSEDWITFSSSSGQENENWVSTVANVAPNQSGVQRTATLQFKPGDDRYETVNINVTQRGYNLNFEVSQAEGSGIIMEDGGTFTLDLDSRFDWKATAPSWLGIEPDSGNASTSISQIKVTAATNTTNANRTGTVTITPLPTEFAGGAILDPQELGILPLYVGVTQFGGREAAISVPWLVEGYTQTSATIEFNFYSPFYEIAEAGLQWGLPNSDEIQTLRVTPSNPTECTVSFDLTGLSPATRYVIRGYVKDSSGNETYGNWSSFSSAGRVPGSTDNPTPTR